RNFYRELHQLLANGEKLIIHQEEVGDRVCGLIAGYLLWANLVPYGPQAISVTERLTGRQLGPLGRSLVASAAQLRDQAQSGTSPASPSSPSGPPRPTASSCAACACGGGSACWTSSGPRTSRWSSTSPSPSTWPPPRPATTSATPSTTPPCATGWRRRSPRATSTCSSTSAPGWPTPCWTWTAGSARWR